MISHFYTSYRSSCPLYIFMGGKHEKVNKYICSGARVGFLYLL
nr:MAG TPA: hypothetical protein [Inoviridae sp.]